MSDDSIVFLNDNYLPLQQAKISVLDRGFLFGDGVYEVIPVFGARIFRFSDHMERLENSLSAIGIINPYSRTEWQTICTEVVRRNPVGAERFIYLQVSRGAGEREHLYDENMLATVFVMCRPARPKSYENGITVITHPDIRWQYCDIKATTLLPGVMLRQLANRTDGSHEVILIREGVVTEGAASNVFVVRDGVVSTPPKGKHILPGITRDLVLELLQSAGIPCEENIIKESELHHADEIWITGSLAGIAPVVKLDGLKVGDGKPGKIWKQADELYQAYKCTEAC